MFVRLRNLGAVTHRVLCITRDLPFGDVRQALEESPADLQSVEDVDAAVPRIRDAAQRGKPFAVVFVSLGRLGDFPEHGVIRLCSAATPPPSVLILDVPEHDEDALDRLFKAGATDCLVPGEGGARLRRSVRIGSDRYLRASWSATTRGRMEGIESLCRVVSRRGTRTEDRLHDLLELGNRIFDTEVAILSRVDGERYEIVDVAASEGGPAAGDVFELRETYCSILLERQEPMLIDHTAETEWSSHPAYRSQGLESYAGVAVHVEDELYGTLNFSSPTPRDKPFVGFERDVLVMMGNWVGSVLEKVRLDRALRRSEARYRDLVENSIDLICVHDLDGTIHAANRALVEAYGGENEEELIGRNLSEFLIEQSGEELSEYLEEVRTRGRARGDLRVRDMRGRERILEFHNTLRDVDVEEPLVRVTARDVTELRRAQERLREREEQLSVFVEHTPAAVAMFDREMCYLAASNRWIQDYRLEDRDLVGLSHYDVFPEISDHWKEIHRRCLAGESDMRDEDPFPRDDGTLDWVRWEVHPWHEDSGELGGLMMFTEVITDRKRVEDAWRYMATHDHLTGLRNRTALLERLERSLDRFGKQDGDYGFAVFFLDLDGFKSINDTYGHAAGDEMLKRVSERLQNALRPKDALARFAGDEFVALVEDVDQMLARSVAKRVLQALAKPYRIHGREMSVGASLGIALPDPTVDAEGLLSRADGAMYRVKQRSGGGFEISEGTLDLQAVQ